MKHINAVAQTLQTTPEIVSKVCQILDLKINKDNTLKPDVEKHLIQLKQVAAAENMSLEEAATHLLQMRDERSGKEHEFDEDEYIEQRFGVKPSEASTNSFVKLLHSDVARGKQLAALRHKVVIESSTLMLEDLLFNGTQETSTELEENQNKIYERIDNDFFGKVNWGEEPHPSLAMQPQQLKSRHKTKSLPEKSSP